MAKLQLRRAPQILERLVARTVSRSALSDLTQSSNTRILLAAVARELDDGYYQLSRLSKTWSIDEATGLDLDERARDIQPGTLQRAGGVRATGQIVFSLAAPTASNIVIPRDTVLTTASGVQVRTLEEAVVTPTSAVQIPGNAVGQDSQAVNAQAIIVGAEGNVDIGTVTGFVAQPADVSTVTNTTAFSGGADRETDDSFRRRLKAYVGSLARSTVQALEFAAVGVTDPTPGSGRRVQFAHVFEDPIERGNVILYVNDGTTTVETRGEITSAAPEQVTAGLLGPPADSAVGGEEFLNLDNAPIDVGTGAPTALALTSSVRGALVAGTDYVLNPANGRIFFTPALSAAEVVTATYTYFTGLIAEVQRVIDGDRADRVNYPGFRADGTRVLVRAPTVIQIAVDGILSVAEGADRASAIAAATSAVTSYVNNLGISADIVRNEIIERIMGVSNVLDVTLITPTDNITILDDQIPRTSTGGVSFS